MYSIKRSQTKVWTRTETPQTLLKMNVCGVFSVTLFIQVYMHFRGKSVIAMV